MAGRVVSAGRVERQAYGRRRTDRSQQRRNRALTFWLLVISGLMALALSGEHKALVQVQQGRASGTAILCAVESAIGEAGRAVISGSGPLGTPEFTRFLEQHGFRPRTLAQRRAAGNRYVQSIAAHIDRELRERGKNTSVVPELLRPDGTLNCGLLSELSHVPVPKR